MPITIVPKACQTNTGTSDAPNARWAHIRQVAMPLVAPHREGMLLSDWVKETAQRLEGLEYMTIYAALRGICRGKGSGVRLDKIRGRIYVFPKSQFNLVSPPRPLEVNASAERA